MLFTKARDFIVELTNHNTIEKNLFGKKEIEKEYRENNEAILSLLLQRGVRIDDVIFKNY